MQEELKEYWDEAYSSSSTRVAYVSTEGKDVTELRARSLRNYFLFNDFIMHCQNRPAPLMNKLFEQSQSCIEVGCGTGEFLVGLMSITNIQMGVGLDLSQAAIQHASTTYDPRMPPGKSITWQVGDMMTAEIRGRMDIVVANQIIEHFRDPSSVIKELQKLAKHVVVVTPYKERIPEWDDDVLDGSDNHLSCIDEATYSEFEVLEDMVFFSKEGWGVSREGECPLQYAALIKGRHLDE